MILNGDGHLRRIKMLAPALVSLLWALYLTVPGWLLGPNSYVLVLDAGDSGLPAAEALKYAKGYWDPFQMCGVDRTACVYSLAGDALPAQWGVPTWLTTAGKLILRYFVAALGSYLLCRHLGLGRTSAAFGASVFSTAETSIQQAHLLSFSAVPMVILICRLLALRGFSVPATAAMVVMTVLTWIVVSHGHSVILTIPFVFFGTFWRLPACARFRALVILGLFWSLWGLAQTQLFYAFAFNGGLSHRANPIYKLALGLDLNAPSTYLLAGGIALSLTVAAAALLLPASKNDTLRADLITFLWVQAVFLAFIAMYPQVRIALFQILPMAATFPFDRSLLGLPLVGSLSGAFALEVVCRHARPSLTRAMLGLIAVITILTPLPALARQFWWIFQGATFRSLYEQPLITALPQPALFGRYRVATIARRIGPYQCFQPAFCWAAGLETADGYASLYPERYREFWSMVSEPCLSQNPDLVQYLKGSTYNRVYLFPNPHSDLAAQTFRLNLLSLANVKYIILDQTTATPFRDASELGLKIIARSDVNWRARPPGERLERLIQGEVPDSPLLIYENESVLPRAWFAPAVRTFATSAALREALVTASPAEMRECLFCLAQDYHGRETDAKADRARPSVVQATQTADRVEVKLENQEPGFVVLSTTCYPPWSCRLDGLPVPIIPAYNTFMAVRVDQPGTHQITFTYRPPYRTAF